MKKILSLALVIVMVFSLMTFASAADPKTTFSDGADVKNVAAVDLLTGIGVIEGANGAFDPTGTLTREQAAKIIAFLLNGTAATNLTAVTAPFSDVAASRWSAGYIAFCVEEGIINGVGDGKFNPEGKLTGFAWAKMLLCALGYDATAEGFVGGTWTINVAKTVNKISLALGLNLDFSADISRDDACALAANALTADMVEYPGTGTTIIVGDATVQTGGGSAQKVEKTGGGYLDAGNDTIMQLCEMYFPQLQKAAATNSGRTGYKWRNAYTLASISAFYSTDKVIATSYAGAATVTALTTSTNYWYKARPDAGIKYWSNGTEITAGVPTNLDAADALVANGVVVELMDSFPYDGDVDNVLITVKKIAKLPSTPVTTTTSGAVTYVTVANCVGLSNIDKTLVHGYEGLAKDDVVKYYSLYDAATTKTHWYIEKCTSVTGTVTAFNDAIDTVTINGTAYFGSALVGKNFTADTSLFGVPDVTFYLDDGGYICYTTTTAPAFNTASAVFIKQTQDAGGVFGYKCQALAVFMDGTSAIINVSKVAENATATLLAPTGADDTPDGTAVAQTVEEYSFYSFTKNDDGSYNLRYAANQVNDYTNAIVTTRTAAFAGANIATVANANTTFVYENPGLGMFFAYTGVANAPLYTVTAAATPPATATTQGIYVLEDSTGSYALAVVGTGGTADTTVTGALEQVYITGSATTIYATPANYYTYPAIVNGEQKTIESTMANLQSGNVYYVSQYTGGRISAVYSEAGADAAWIARSVNDAATTNFTWTAGVLTVDAANYLTTADAKVFVYDTRVIPATITTYSLDQIEGLDALVDGNDRVAVSYVSTSNTNVANIYVMLVSGTVTADMTFTLTTPPDDGSANVAVVNQLTDTITVNVANSTASVELTGGKTAAQTVTVGGVNAALVTPAGTATAPTYTVDTSAIAAAGGTYTFTLAVAEPGYVTVTYTVTLVVAP